MAGISGDVFAAAGIEDRLGEDGDGGEFDGTTGQEGGAGGAGDGFGAVDMALG